MLLEFVDDAFGFSQLGEEDNADESGKNRRFTAPSASILVTDDNEMNIVVFKSLVKRLQIPTDTTESADEAIEKTLKNKYDIIFMDHMMPEKDGIEALHEIRENPDNPNVKTPVICLTANVSEGAMQMYFDAGFDGYLTKPIDADIFEGMLLKYLPAEMIEDAPDEDDGKAGDNGESNEILKALYGSAIDVKTGLKNSGSMEDYMPLLKLFYESIDGKSKELKGYYEAEDFENYTIKVHALKSSARLIGAVGFGEDAQALEDAGKNREYGYIREHHKELMDECAALKELFCGVFSGDDLSDEENKPEASSENMKEAYERLKAAADEMDIDAIEEVFEDMKKYSIPKEEKPLWNAVKDAASQYDYDGILECLK